MFNLTANEVTSYYNRCHGPYEAARESVHQWEMRMRDLLGPDDCKFLIRSLEEHLRNLWLIEGHNDGQYFHPSIKEAARFNWGETAIRCSNNRRLEALRIINDHEALDSKGKVTSLNP